MSSVRVPDNAMADTIRISRKASEDSFGNQSYDILFDAKAKIQRATRFVPGIRGKSLEVHYTVITCTEIRNTDRVWLPDDDIKSDGRRPSVVEYLGCTGQYTINF